MTGKKRVKFKDHEDDHSPGHRLDASSAPRDEAEALGLGDPKTSEYAFFKKFKQDVSQNIDFYERCKESNQLKDHRSTDDIVISTLRNGCKFIAHGGMGNMKHKGFISKSHVKKASATVPDSFLSPLWVPLRSSDITSKVNVSCKNLNSSSLLKSQTPNNLDSFLSPSANASTTAVSQCRHEDVFTAKRHKLHQWISKTFFPDNNELPKGCDLLSMLYLRLLPKRTEYNHSESLKIRQVRKTTKSELFAFPELSTQFKESWIPRKLPKAEEIRILDKGVSACSDTLGERCPLQQMVEGPYAHLIGFADRPLLGSKGWEAEEDHFLNDHYKRLPDRFIEHPLPKWKGNYDSFATFGADMTSLECEPAWGQLLNDVSSRHWRCKSEDRTLSVWNSCGGANSSSATSTNGKLLDYRKRDLDGNLDAEAASSSDTGKRFSVHPPIWKVGDYDSFAAFSADISILGHKSAWYQFFNDVSSRCWPHRSEGSTLSIWNTFEGSNSFPAASTNRNLLDYEKREPDCYLEDQAALSSDSWSDSYQFGNVMSPLVASALKVEQVDFDNSLKNHRSSRLLSPVESDEPNDINDLVIKRNSPHAVFLGWDVDKLKHMLNFSSNSSVLQHDLFPVQSMLLNKHYWHNPENLAAPGSLGSSRLQLGGLVSNSLVGVDSYGYRDCHLETLYTEEKKFPVAGLDTDS